MTQAFRQLAEVERFALLQTRADDTNVSDEVLHALAAVRAASALAEELAASADADLCEHVMALDAQIMPSQLMLWERCTARISENSFSQMSGAGKRLSSLLLDLYLRCMKLAQSGQAAGESAQARLGARAMHAVRWCAKWSWIRYERPSGRLWMMAAYFYQCAEHADQHRTELLVHAGSAGVSTLEREYICLLFVDWVGPQALSPLAIDILDRLVIEALQHAMLSKKSLANIDNILDLSSGRLVIEANPAQSEVLRYLSLGNLRERLRSSLESISGQSAALLNDAIEFIWRSPVIRSKRHMVRMGVRTNVIQTGLIKYGYGQLLHPQRNFHFSGHVSGEEAFGYQGYKECVLREVSPHGCKVFVPKRNVQNFRIGALASICNLQGGGFSLGIVRWLTRDAAGNMLIGMWLLTGAISLFQAHPASGIWPSGKKNEAVLVVDDLSSESEGLAIVLSKNSYTDIGKLHLPESGLVLEKLRFLESGLDFDLALFRPAGAEL